MKQRFFVTLATSWIVLSQIEEAMFAAIAALTLYVVFTLTLTSQRLADTVVMGTGCVTVTC